VAKGDPLQAFPVEERPRRWHSRTSEQRWTLDFLEAGSRSEPRIQGQLLATFDLLEEWYTGTKSFKECSFMSVLLEMGTDPPVGQACVRHLATSEPSFPSRGRGRTDRAEDFAKTFHILMEGVHHRGHRGHHRAARRAQDLAQVLIQQHRAVRPSTVVGRQRPLITGAS